MKNTLHEILSAFLSVFAQLVNYIHFICFGCNINTIEVT